MISLLSLAGAGVAEVTLAMARCCCPVMLAMALPRRRWLWRDVTPSHGGDGIAEATLAVA
jgi:hypothetical protein